MTTSSFTLGRIATMLALAVCILDGVRDPATAQSGTPGETAKSLADELPRIPPKSPEESMQCFEILPGFQIELVAAEPLVVDPIAFAFDARERLFVVEMVDYSEQEHDALGRIVLLEDRDRDGQMDHRSVFVEHLSWPTAVHPWKDGVLVLAPPYLSWYRDTNDDGQHDIAETWYTGFGRSNVQGMANSLRWSVEGYLVGATSGAGAELVDAFHRGETHMLRGRDFQIDPLEKRLKPISGGGQHGLAMNRWGDRFVTSNSNHLQQILDIDAWLQSHFVGNLALESRRSIAADGPQAEVFRISPVEPWRLVRTRMRVSGEAPGAIEGGGRAAGYFTGATGTWIMDAEMGFGESGIDTALVCDVGSNLVHRKRLEPDGLFWRGERIDHGTELVRSSDIWFRPVQLGDGPDGALYIADMYREVIEHPKSLPPAIKQHLDLTSGNDRGRIWRLRSTHGTVSSTDKSRNELPFTQVANAELVKQLESRLAWRRLTASRLLLERQAHDVREELVVLLSSARPETSILAMHLLARLKLLNESDLEAVLVSRRESQVLRHAIGIIRNHKDWHELVLKPQRQTELISIKDDRLWLEMVMLAADFAPADRVRILNSLVTQTHAPALRSAVIAASGAASLDLHAVLRQVYRTENPKLEKEWLSAFVPFWTQLRSRADDDSPELRSFDQHLQDYVHQDLKIGPERIAVWSEAMLGLSTQDTVERFLQAWADEDRQTFLKSIELELTKAANSGKISTPIARRLRFASTETRRLWLESHVTPTSPMELQVSVLEACDFADPLQTSAWVIENFEQLTPAIRQSALARIAGRTQSAEVLASAIENKTIAATQIPPMVRQSLTRVPSAKLRQRFEKCFEEFVTTNADISRLIERYTPMVDASLNSASPESLARGRASFEKVCSACHRLDQLGNDVGPELKSLHEKSPAQLLVSILDPNREVDPRFQAWTILMGDGRVISGVIREESSNQIVVAEASGRVSTLARNEIDEMKASGVSLMPAGLDQQLNPQAMADLVAWLRTRH